VNNSVIALIVGKLLGRKRRSPFVKILRTFLKILELNKKVNVWKIFDKYLTDIWKKKSFLSVKLLKVLTENNQHFLVYKLYTQKHKY
jgi:hypothetical protein